MPHGDEHTRPTSEQRSREALDLSAIRARFSALSRDFAGSPVVYLDGPGGSHTPDSVARAMAAYLTSSNANTDGPFVTSQATAR